MSKEKMEDIKNYTEYATDNLAYIKIEDYEWLIEQASRVEMLKERNKFLEKAHRINVNIAEDMKKERNRYREALSDVTKILVLDGYEPSVLYFKAYQRAKQELESDSDE